MKTKLLFVLLLNTILTHAQINWSLCTNGKPYDYAPIDMAMAPNNDVYVLCTQSGTVGYVAKLLKSSNFGNLWTEIIMNGIPPIQSNALIFAGSKLLMTGNISTSTNNVMYVSSDNGQNWSLNNTGFPNSYTLEDFTKDAVGNIYLGGIKPVGTSIAPFLAKSSDNGATWSEVTMNGIPANAFVEDALGYAGGKLLMSRYDPNTNIGHMLASTDGGLNWTNSSNGIFTAFRPYDIVTANSGEIFSVGTIQGTELMYSSTNNGQNWNQVSTSGSNGMDRPTAMLQSTGPLLICGISTSFFTSYIFRDQAAVVLNENEPQSFQLFPIPANNHLKILAGEITISEIQQVEIISVSGQTIKTFTRNFELLDINDLEIGIYVLRLKTSTSVFYKKFLKQE